ncbi:hypothetical protein [Legionella sp.]|uniref:hypothetical protein n=1 Tax=Legionella sp. TaxID=459 RepID=UPI003220335A
MAENIDRPDQIIKRFFLSNKCCVKKNPQCSGTIVNAHTISKKYLKFISSEDNHIYYPERSSFNKNGLYQFSCKGINKCSTFLGFCDYHDKNLFSSFENKDYDGRYKQIFDLSFRVLCREYFQKKCLLKFLNKLLQGKLPYSTNLSQEKREIFILNKNFIAQEVREHQNLFNKLKSYGANKLKYVQIKLSKIPFATTGVIFPCSNYKGEILQTESELQKGIIYFVLPVQKYSYVVFSFPSDKKRTTIQANFTNSIIELIEEDKNYFIDYLLTLLIDNNDIVAIEPKWYEETDKNLKSKINELINRRVGQYFNHSMQPIKFLDFSGNLQFTIISTDKRNT